MDRPDRSYKVIISGKVVELYQYKNEPKIPFSKKDELLDRRNTLCSKQKNIIRSRNNLRRLVLANFTTFDQFLTLTFSDNIVDIEKANYYFKLFIQRLRRRYPKIKYLVVPEFQERGAVHYHGFFTLKRAKCKYNDFRKLWKYGFVWIAEVEDIDNTGAYLLKYLSKDMVDQRLCGKKSYLASRNLKRPIVLSPDDSLVFKIALYTEEPVYSSVYEIQKTQNAVTYEEYNFNRQGDMFNFMKKVNVIKRA